ncbi:D-arabinono-1,4-lactone oxidase [Roseobacteraceae bacterium NS-SX3]
MWTNWAGNQQAEAAVVRPGTLEALRAALAGAARLRPAGAGHSFTPLVAGGDTVLRLDRIGAGPVLECEGTTAWVDANARLKALSPALAGQGLAFRNLGDINVQTLAGAAATATHGTGQDLPCVSAEILAARVMTADGAVLDSETEAGLLPALQVSLGLLGVLLEVKLSLVPKYGLRRQVTLAPIGETLDSKHRLWEENRNFEFFYLPFSGRAVQIRHNLADGPEGKPPADLDNLAVRVLKGARNLGRLHPALRRALLNLLALTHSDEDYVGESWRVLCSQRDVRFVEMEYHVPPAAARQVLEEVIARTEQRHPHIYFPIEVRQTAGDSAWLSPFQGGRRVSIAIHADAKEGDRGYFADIEPIFRAAGGRPHWGKIHGLGQRDLEALYPDFGQFCDLRQRLDPENKFLTPALTQMFGG